MKPCEHRHWLPLIVHGGVTLSICLNCGAHNFTANSQPPRPEGG